MTTADIRDLDARAVRASVDVVEGITALDLSRPTPCSEWTLGDLLAHMTVQHRGFAAASAGRGADPAVWKAGAPSPDPVADYAMAAELVIAAFARARRARARLRDAGDHARHGVPGSAGDQLPLHRLRGARLGRRASARSALRTRRRPGPGGSPHGRGRPRGRTAADVPEPRSDPVWPRQTTPARWTGSSPCSAATLPGRRPSSAP